MLLAGGGPGVMTDDNQLIFISIASYRDSQLLPTVLDLLRKAHEPGLLRFGICWQRDLEDGPSPFDGDARFRVLDVNWRHSQGACWARAEIMKLWQGEQWYLQVDSHCRFEVGWDTKLIRMAQQTGSPKPILSTYAHGFTPREADAAEREVLGGTPQLIALEGFTSEGLPKLKPLAVPEAETRNRPVAARFLAAGFLFAPGSFVGEVPYDPTLYFFGEEIAMTLRAYTSGYDLFHPVEHIAWHDYERTYARRHWDDEKEAEGARKMAERAVHWGERDRLSRERVQVLLEGGPEALSGGAVMGRYGLGKERTRAEYERYAGISFRLRKLQDYTRYALEPPNPEEAEDWPNRIYHWLVRVVVEVATLSPAALEETSFWVVALQDEAQREIWRHDFQRRSMEIDTDQERVVVVCEMESGIVPAFWSVQPFSHREGWGQRLQGTLNDDDFSIVLD